MRLSFHSLFGAGYVAMVSRPLGRLDWSKWIYGLISTMIAGGAGAVSSGIGANIVVPNLQMWQTFSIMGMTFCVSGVLAGLAYLHISPLPPVTVTETETTKLTTTPSGKETLEATKSTSKTTTQE